MAKDTASNSDSFSALTIDESRRARELDKAKAKWFQHLHYITQCEDVSNTILDMDNSNEITLIHQRRMLLQEANANFTAMEVHQQNIFNDQLRKEEQDKLEFYNQKWRAFYKTSTEMKLQELTKRSDYAFE